MTLIQYFHVAFETWAIIFSIVAAIIVFSNMPFDPEASITLIGLLITDAIINASEILAIVSRGNTSAAGFFISRISNFLVFELGYVLVAFAAAHAECIVVTRGGKRDRTISLISYFLAAVGSVLVILSRFFGFYYTFDDQNRYYRKDSFFIAIIFYLLALFPMIIRAVRNYKYLRKREFLSLLMFVVLPFIGIGIQPVFFGISVYNIANSIALIVLVMVHQLEYSEDNIARAREMYEDQLRAFHSQIHPHFIYNSLAAIRSYIPEDSEARDLLDNFTGFLRGSLDLLQDNKCVEAEREFELVDDYLALVEVRFDGKLKVMRDAQDRDFLIPPFSVQTVVENAITHGIRAKESGSGTLLLKSYETEDSHVVEVTDDGVGFDPAILNEKKSTGLTSSLANDNRSHIGLLNVRNRLAMMCGGRLDIESEIGKSTTVRITVPKKWSKNL